MRIEKDFPISNTFGIEAKCKYYIEYGSTDDAVDVCKYLQSHAEPFMIVGRGSNLLLTRNFDGIIVHSAMVEISHEGEFVTAGSGATFDDVVVYSINHGLYGLENLSLIPGEAGASAVQNIGAYGIEVANCIHAVDAIEIATGQQITLGKKECDYSYRYSRFKGDWKGRFLITRVTYKLGTKFIPLINYGNIRERIGDKTDNLTAERLRQAIINIRREKLPDPKITGNAGSFFTNPIVERNTYEKLQKTYPDMPHYDTDDGRVKLSAAWMIEQCGWKGKNMGRVGVHPHQALVLVNNGGATGQEVLSLSRNIIEDVRKRFGVMLTPEVNIV